MFFHITMNRTLLVHPRYFGPTLQEHLQRMLHREVEGTYSAKYGFIISVTKIDSISKGQVQEGTGYCQFPVVYKAVVFRAFRNEVLDAVVTEVNKLGFFAEAGPMRIFVTKQLIPENYTFDPQATPPCYVGEEYSGKIQRNAEVRLKIINVRNDNSNLVIGSINDHYLGVLSE